MIDSGELRQAFVKLSLAEIADALFGPGVKLLGIVTTPEDHTKSTVSLIVADHESLPLMAPGDDMTMLRAEVTEHVHGVRTTEFRAFAVKGN